MHMYAFCNFTLVFNKTFRILLFIVCRQRVHCSKERERPANDDDGDSEEEEEKKLMEGVKESFFFLCHIDWFIHSVGCANTRLLPCLTSLFCCHESDANVVSPFCQVQVYTIYTDCFTSFSINISFWNSQLLTRDFNRNERKFYHRDRPQTQTHTRPVAGNYRQINDTFSHPIVFLMKVVNSVIFHY